MAVIYQNSHMGSWAAGSEASAKRAPAAARRGGRPRPQRGPDWGKVREPTWEFPKNRALFRGPYNKDHSISGSIVGARNFWKLPLGGTAGLEPC